jgi:hypothetical protein
MAFILYLGVRNFFMRPDALFIFPLGNIDMPGPTVTFVDLSGNETDITPVANAEPVLQGKPHPVDEFALVFYQTLDQMRLDFGDLMSYKFQCDREVKAETKEVRKQLLKIKVNDYKEKVRTFFTEIEENLTKW